MKRSISRWSAGRSAVGTSGGQTVFGSEPTEVEPRLWVHQVDVQRRFERSWGELQGYLLGRPQDEATIGALLDRLPIEALAS